MAYEWLQHNIAYELLPDSEFKASAKDVDLDPDDQGLSLEEIYRVLKKGGCINIICEGSDPEAIDWPKIDGFFKIYRPSELQELLLEAHFKDVAVHHGQGQYISVVGVK